MKPSTNNDISAATAVARPATTHRRSQKAADALLDNATLASKAMTKKMLSKAKAVVVRRPISHVDAVVAAHGGGSKRGTASTSSSSWPFRGAVARTSTTTAGSAAAFSKRNSRDKLSRNAPPPPTLTDVTLVKMLDHTGMKNNNKTMTSAAKKRPLLDPTTTTTTTNHHRKGHSHSSSQYSAIPIQQQGQVKRVKPNTFNNNNNTNGAVAMVVPPPPPVPTYKSQKGAAATATRVISAAKRIKAGMRQGMVVDADDYLFAGRRRKSIHGGGGGGIESTTASTGRGEGDKGGTTGVGGGKSAMKEEGRPKALLNLDDSDGDNGYDNDVSLEVVDSRAGAGGRHSNARNNGGTAFVIGGSEECNNMNHGSAAAASSSLGYSSMEVHLSSATTLSGGRIMHGNLYTQQSSRVGASTGNDCIEQSMRVHSSGSNNAVGENTFHPIVSISQPVAKSPEPSSATNKQTVTTAIVPLSLGIGNKRNNALKKAPPRATEKAPVAHKPPPSFEKWEVSLAEPRESDPTANTTSDVVDNAIESNNALPAGGGLEQQSKYIDNKEDEDIFTANTTKVKETKYADWYDPEEHAKMEEDAAANSTSNRNADDEKPSKSRGRKSSSTGVNDNFVRLDLRNSAGSCRGARNLKKVNKQKLWRAQHRFGMSDPHGSVDDGDGSGVEGEKNPHFQRKRGGGGGAKREANAGDMKCFASAKNAGVDPLDDYMDGAFASQKNDGGDKATAGKTQAKRAGSQKPQAPKRDEGIPICTRHQRPCKLLTVKRNNKGNKGRKFYVCSLPKGEQCDFFKWEEDTMEVSMTA